jgi:hypothetical protein
MMSMYKILLYLLFWFLFLFHSFTSAAQSTVLKQLLDIQSDTAVHERLFDYYEYQHVRGDSVYETKIANYLFDWAKRNKNNYIKVEAFYWLAYTFQKNNYKLCLKNRTAGLLLAQKINSKRQEAYGYYLVAHAHWDVNKNILAYENFIKSFELFEQIGFHDKLLANHYTIYYTKFLYQIQEYSEALRVLKLAEANVDTTNFFALSQIPNTMGLCYRKLQDYRNSIIYFKKTFQVAKHYQNEVWMAIALDNLGDALITLKRYDEAIPYLIRAVDLAFKNKYWYIQAEASARLAQSYIAVHQYEKGLNTLQTNQAIIDTCGDMETKKNATLQYALYYGEKQNKEFELKYLKQYYLLKDSAFNKKFGNNYIDARISLSAKNNLEKVKRIDSEKKVALFTRNLSILVLIFLLFLGAVFYNYKRIKYRQKQLELEIAANKLEQEKIIKENELTLAESKLKDFAQNIIEKNQLIEQIQLEPKSSQVMVLDVHSENIEKINELSQLTILTDDDWQNFKSLFDQAFPNFLTALIKQYPQLTKAEQRFICLSKLNLPIKDLANMLAISPESVRKTKYRLRDKLAQSGEDINAILSI